MNHIRGPILRSTAAGSVQRDVARVSRLVREHNSAEHTLHLDGVRSPFAPCDQKHPDFQFSPNFSIKISLEAPRQVPWGALCGGAL